MLKDTLLNMRKKHGYSQQEIAKILDVTRQTISNWESGQGAPTLDKAKQLSELYHISLDDLAGNDVEFVVKKTTSRLLMQLVGTVCKIDCKDLIGCDLPSKVRILEITEDWVKIEYERTKENTLLKKEKVMKYIEQSMINGFEIVEEES